MNLTVITPPVNFWDTASDAAYPALLRYGYTLFQQIANPAIFRRIILANGKPQLSVLAGYNKLADIKPLQGFSNTGNTLLQPSGDAGLFAVSEAYMLNWYDTTKDNPIEITLADLIAIDTSLIPKEDFRMDKINSDQVVLNFAVQT